MTSRLERTAVVSSGSLATLAGGALIGLGSVVGPVIALSGTIALVVGVAAFLSLTFGLVLVTILTFFETIPTLGGDITFVRLAGVIVILAWITLALNRRSNIRLLIVDHPQFAYALLLFVAWAGATALWAPDPSLAFQSATSLLLVGVLVFVTYSAIRDVSQLRIILWAFVLGASGTTLYGLLLGLSTGGENRLIGGIGNPNDLAASLVPSIVIAAVLAATSRRPAGRAVAGTALAICIVALFMTQSRGGLVGLAVALIVALFYGGQLRPYAVALLLVFVAIGLGNYFVFANTTDRARLVDLSAEGSSGRADTWRLGLTVAKDHPLRGVGLGNFREVETRYVTSNFSLIQIRTVLKKPVPHNVYIQLVAETGLIGLVLNLAVIGGALAIGMRSIRQLATVGDREAELLGRGVIVAIVGLLGLYTFHGSLIEKELWLLLGLATAFSVIAGRAKSRHEQARQETLDGPPVTPVRVV